MPNEDLTQQTQMFHPKLDASINLLTIWSIGAALSTFFCSLWFEYGIRLKNFLEKEYLGYLFYR